MLSMQVKDKDIDQLGHVNNQQYLDWMLVLANAHAQSVGLNFETLKAEFNKVMVAREHKMKFLASCFQGDELVIATWIGEKLGCCQRLRHYQFIRLGDQRTVFQGETVWACMTLNTYKPCKLPEAFTHRYHS